MKTAPSLLALTALLTLCGCPGSDDACFATPPPPPGGNGSPSPAAYEVNAPASLQVFAVQGFACGADAAATQLPSSVSAQVYDPENTPLPVEASLGGSGLSATLRFTPGRSGRHHVLVAFAPVGSVQQFGVYVARPWTGSAPVQLPLPRCTQLDRTARGTWLCDGVALREPGARPVRLGTSTVAPDVAVAGNVVWVVGEGRVRRFVDTGTDLELTGSLLLGASLLTIHSRLATENELLVLDSLDLHRFTFTDSGVLAAAGRTVWAPSGARTFGVDSAAGLLVRLAEDRLGVVQMERPPDSRACHFQLQPSGAYAAVITAGPNGPQPLCQPLPGTPVGYEEGTLWTRVGDPFRPPFAQTLHLWRAQDGSLVEQGNVVLDAPVEGILSSLRPGFVIPDIRLGTAPGAFSVVPLAPSRPGPLGLERLPGTPSLSQELRTVSPRFFWEGDSRQLNGSTLVFERTTG
jgi:hypothetical protein